MVLIGVGVVIHHFYADKKITDENSLLPQQNVVRLQNEVTIKI